MKETFRAINRMVEEGIIENYAVGGAIGAMFYVEPFATQDIDVFVMMPLAAGSLLISLDSYAEYLAHLGYQSKGEGFEIEGWLVQFIPVYDELTEEGYRDAGHQDIDGTLVRVMSAEHLVAIMLRAGRLKDYARAQTFLNQDAVDIAALMDILRRHGLEGRWQEFTLLKLS